MLRTQLLESALLGAHRPSHERRDYGPGPLGPGGLDLGRVLELLRTHIIAALCRTVFASVRITERQLRWKSLAHVRGGRKILKLTY
jgi:hypothetical protein